jgi:hypothetical protein
MEAQESDQSISRRVLALSQLLVTALQPEEWAALAAVPFEDNSLQSTNSKGNSTDAGEVRQ